MQTLLRTMDLLSWLHHRASQYVQAPKFLEQEVPGRPPSCESILLYLLGLAALGGGLTLCLAL